MASCVPPPPQRLLLASVSCSSGHFTRTAPAKEGRQRAADLVLAVRTAWTSPAARGERRALCPPFRLARAGDLLLPPQNYATIETIIAALDEPTPSFRSCLFVPPR